MNPIEIKISDSARLFAVSTDKFKKNILTMSVFLPIADKTLAYDMLFPAVLLRGTERYPENADIRKRLEELYAASINVNHGYFGDSLMTGYSAEFLSDAALLTGSEIFGGVIDLLAQIWYHPVTDGDGCLRRSEVEKSKNALRDLIKSEINNTDAYASNRCRELMCATEPYGCSVTADDVMHVTAQALSERYREVRDGAYITFFYVGALDGATVAQSLRNAFVKAPGCHGRLHLPMNATKASQVIRKDVTMPVSQGKLVMGFCADGVLMRESDEYYEMCLMADVWGGSPSSKLFANVRERLGLCYYCSSYFENFKGIIYVSSGIETSNREMAESEILRQLEEIQRGNVTERELEAAVLSIENSYAQIEDSPYSIYAFCFGRLMLGMDCSPERFIEKIRRVGCDGVVRAAMRVKLKTVYFLAGDKKADEMEDSDEKEPESDEYE